MTEVQTLAPRECWDQMSAVGSSPRFIDVRTQTEFGAGHAKGAVNVPLDTLNRSPFPDSEGVIYVICQRGNRSLAACNTLVGAGFTQVINVDGGTLAWAQAGLPMVREPGWRMSLERQVNLATGALTFGGTLLGAGLSPFFYIIPAAVGAGLVLAGLTGRSFMAVLLAHMPWNRGKVACPLGGRS